MTSTTNYPNNTPLSAIGEVTIVKTNIRTGEQITHTQRNVITYNRLLMALNALFATGSMSTSSAIATQMILISQYTPSSPWDYYPTIRAGANRTWGYVDPSQTTPKFVFNDYGDMYTEYVRRFAAPVGGPRTIRRIVLTGIPESNGSGNYPSTSLPYESSNLSSYDTNIVLDPPCVQAEDELLDVYYRILTPYADGLTTVCRDIHRPFAGLITTGGFNNVLYTTTFNSIAVSSFPYDATIPSRFNNVIVYGWGSTTSSYITARRYLYGIESGTSTNAVSVSNHAIARTYTIGLLDAVGIPFTSGHQSVDSSSYGGYVRGSAAQYKYTLPGGSTIQNVHGHSSSSVYPFIDATYLANGSGKVIPTSTTPPATHPEFYRVEITSTGDVGVAQYRLRVRHHRGFIGNTYTMRPEIVGHVSVQQPLSDTPIGRPQYVSIPGGHGIGFTDAIGLSSTGRTTQIYEGMGQSKQYDYATIYNFDYTGVTKVRITDTSYYKNFDSTTSPALPVTNIRQCNKDLAGNIWVACDNTGLFKISADDTTVTKVAVPGVDDDACYAVDCSNTHVWAVFRGGLASSTDSGATWTIYNDVTPIQFSWAGISDDMWSTVSFIRVNPEHVDQRIILVRKSTAADANTNSAVWWSLTTAATSAHSTAIYGQSHCASTKGQDHLLQTSGDYWISWTSASGNPWSATTTTSTMKLLTFGSTSIISVTKPSDVPTAATCSIENGFAPDPDTSVMKPIFLSSESSTTHCIGLVEPDGTISKYVHDWHPRHLTSVQSYGNSSASGMHLSFGRPIVNMGSGVLLSYVSDSASSQSSNDNRVNRLHPVMAFIGSRNDPLGGTPFGPWFWKEYGWNGTSWVENHPSGKPTHLDDQPIINDITIRFESGTATDFIMGDYYTFGRMSGILKDDATSMTWTNYAYSLPMTRDNVISGVISSRPGTTTTPIAINRTGGNINPSTGKYHHSYSSSTVGGTMSTIRSLTPGFLQGNFEVSHTIEDGSTETMWVLGVGNNVLAPEVTQTTPSASATASATYNRLQDAVLGFRISNTNLLYKIDGTVDTTTSPYDIGTSTGVTLVNGDVVSIRRDTGVWTLLVNGSVVYTRPGTLTTDTVYAAWAGVSGSTEQSFAPLDVVYNGSEIAVDLGDSGSNTGVFHPQFVSICSAPASLNTAIVDGNPAPVTITNSPNPPPGEVHISQMYGRAYFNAADIGRSFTITYAYLTDPQL